MSFIRRWSPEAKLAEDAGPEAWPGPGCGLPAPPAAVTGCILVLGIHRSGTSCVAGVLHHLGVSMGPQLLGSSRHNLRGHFEDAEVLELHRKILGERGPRGELIPGAWRHPRFRGTACREEYRALLEIRSRQPLWGLKDPRLCHLMPLFLAAYPGPLRVICLQRDREAVVASLHARESAAEPGFTRDMAWWIVNQHRERLTAAVEAAARRGPVLLLDYDAIIGNPRGAVGEIANFVGIIDVMPAVDFVDPAMCHFGKAIPCP
jgi:hypothetical protein